VKNEHYLATEIREYERRRESEEKRNEEWNRSFGIKMKMERGPISALDLAAAMDLFPSHLSELEHGKRRWTHEFAVRYLGALAKLRFGAPVATR
jgi:hypothetical protein